MEAGELVTRQSAIHRPPASNRDHPERRQNGDTAHNSLKEGYAMATAAVAAPSAPYHSRHSSASYPTTYPLPAQGASIPSMLSPVEPRRSSDESDAMYRPPRQSLPSLPSLSHIMHDPKVASFTTPQTPVVSAPQRPPLFTASQTRPYSDMPSENHTSPRTMYPSSSYPPRPEILSVQGLSGPARSGFSTRAVAPPPLSMPGGLAMTGEQQSPAPGPPERSREGDLRQHPEPAQHQLNGGYSHSSQQTGLSQHPPSVLYAQSGQLPPGQLPLPGIHDISPRQTGAALPSLYESRHSIYADDDSTRSKYENRPHHAFDSWHYNESTVKAIFSKLAFHSRMINNFVETFDFASREQNGTPTRPVLPDESDITNTMEAVGSLQSLLEDLRGLVQQNQLQKENARMQDDRARDMMRESGAPVRKPTDDEDMNMYSDPHRLSHHGPQPGPQHQHSHQHHPHHSMPQQPAYVLADVKKRRGVSHEPPPGRNVVPRVADPPRKRAAPPGRCHSCNRVDTPEWRRGPDGARTLCNACGLHYAKLERKRQHEQRTLRPKGSDGP